MGTARNICKCLFLLVLFGCQGAAVTPPLELPSVKSGDQELDSGNTTDLVAVPSDFKLTFTGAIQSSDLTSENLSLVCEEDVTYVISALEDSDGIADNEYTLEPAEPISQQTQCTITLRSTLTQSGDLSFNFTTPCATAVPFRDEFRSQGTFTGDSACWTGEEGNGSGVSASVDSGRVTFTMGTSVDSFGTSLGYYIPEWTPTENMTFQTRITDFENFEYQGSASEQSGIQIAITDSSGADYAACGLMLSSNNNVQPYIQTKDNGSTTTVRGSVIGQGRNLSDVTGGEAIYFYMRIIGDTYTCSYRVGEEGTYTIINSTALTIVLGDNISFAIPLFHGPGSSTSFTLDFINGY